MKSGLRIPHPTYKRSTRSTTNKDEEQSYSKNRGKERRQEAPAYSTKCLSRWWFSMVIVLVVVPLFGSLLWVPSGIPRSRSLPTCWCAIGWTLVSAVMINGGFRIITVQETCHRSGRWWGGSRPARSGRHASGYPVSRDPGGDVRYSLVFGLRTVR